MFGYHGVFPLLFNFTYVIELEMYLMGQWYNFILSDVVNYVGLREALFAMI